MFSQSFKKFQGPSLVHVSLRRWLGQEVEVRKVCAWFGVVLRTGTERSAGEGLFYMWKRNNCCCSPPPPLSLSPSLPLSLCSGGFLGQREIYTCGEDTCTHSSKTERHPESLFRLQSVSLQSWSCWEAGSQRPPVPPRSGGKWRRRRWTQAGGSVRTHPNFSHHISVLWENTSESARGLKYVSVSLHRGENFECSLFVLLQTFLIWTYQSFLTCFSSHLCRRWTDIFCFRSDKEAWILTFWKILLSTPSL